VSSQQRSAQLVVVMYGRVMKITAAIQMIIASRTLAYMFNKS